MNLFRHWFSFQFGIDSASSLRGRLTSSTDAQVPREFRENAGCLNMRAAAAKLVSAIPKARRDGSSLADALEGRYFERLIEGLSGSLARRPAAEIACEIDRWIDKIAIDSDIDRSSLAQVDSKSGNLIVCHSWARGNLAKVPIGFNLSETSPALVQTLMSGRTLVYSRVSELTPNFAGDLKTFRPYVPRSNVTVALKVHGRVVGAIGFATLRKERSWSPRLVRRSQLVAEIFGNAVERARTTEEIALVRNELNHLARVATMGELTAALTHQLSQPIAAILSNAESIQSILESERPDLEELRAAVSDIVQDDLRATEIIKGLRAFFRKDRIEKERLDLREVVGEVIRMVRGNALSRKASLEFRVPSSLPCVAGNRVQLQQVVLNLILNALDAVSECSHAREVTASIFADGDQVKVAVCDSGRGIDPAVISQIFEPFFTTKARGMGMGLCVARSIVEAHAGQLTAHNNSDRGATFEVSLPAF